MLRREATEVTYSLQLAELLLEIILLLAAQVTRLNLDLNKETFMTSIPNYATIRNIGLFKLNIICYHDIGSISSG